MTGRSKLVPLLLAGALLAASSGCSETTVSSGLPLRPEIADQTVREDVFPIVQARYPGGIVARPHIEFANQRGYRPLQLDLYAHDDHDDAIARPLIVWVHGGGWERGDARSNGAFANWPATLATIAARGYVIASIDYRLGGEVAIGDQVRDLKNAIRFLRQNASRFGIDPEKIGLWGGSAGAHLAALEALTCDSSAFAPEASTARLTGREAATARPLVQSDCVQAVAAWYGAFDLTSLEGQGSAIAPAKIRALLRCGEDCDTAARNASPVSHVDAHSPPFLLMHGQADDSIVPVQSQRMAEALRKAGAPVDLILVDRAGHGWIAPDRAQSRRDALDALNHTVLWFDGLFDR